MEGDEEEGRRRQDINNVPSVPPFKACPVRSTWTCSKRRAVSEVMAWGDFYFLRGLKGFAAHECMDLFVDIWPQIFEGR